MISDPRDVYYLTGLLPSPLPVLLYLKTDGDSCLIGPGDEGEAAVETRVAYEPHTLYTLNPDPVTRLAAVLTRWLDGVGAIDRIGWQAEALPRLLSEVIEQALLPREWIEIDHVLTDLQQCKDPDEIALLRKAVACSLAGYAAAERVIADGANELEVLAAAQSAAMLEAGEPIHHGGDYRCGAFGGPARFRLIEAGELYIIDAQTTYRGYWSDLARTYAVGEPTALQRSVYEHLAGVLAAVPAHVQVGGSCTAFWYWLDARIREHPALADTGLIHHGGHGVGTRGHEAPDINRDRDGLFQVGNVFSCEPGGYLPELCAGIRLENTFLITEQGVENLSPYPLKLKT
jgi:Xaa-Pro aminopeptidase